MSSELPHNGRLRLSRRVLLLSFGALAARLWTLQGTSSSQQAVEAADRQRHAVDDCHGIGCRADGIQQG